MRRTIFLGSLGTVFILLSSGCTVRHYIVTKDRVDQDLTAGNKGYVAGKAPETMEESNRATSRNTYVTEIELPIFGKHKENWPASAAQAPEKAEGVQEETAGEENLTEERAAATPAESREISFEKYTVVSGDTLEKISKKFYGTVKKWNEIYKANQDTLKAPNKIYPGQVLNIPVEKLKEPKENLK
jgi:nucleoid-associated protein YgaU